MGKGLCVLLIFIVACTPEIAQESATPEITVQESSPVPEITSKPAIAQKPSKVPVEVIVERPDECANLGCPPGNGVAADLKSDLFYECYCQRASWIRHEDLLCFVSAADALDKGYRQAKSC